MRPYSDKFKQKIVAQIASGKTSTELAKKYKISAGTALSWLKKHKRTVKEQQAEILAATKDQMAQEQSAEERLRIEIQKLNSELLKTKSLLTKPKVVIGTWTLVAEDFNVERKGTTYGQENRIN